MAVAGGPGQLVSPVVSGVSIGGTPQEGMTVVGSVAVVVGFPTPVVTFQWLLDGADIAGATSTSYTVAVGEAGHSLALMVTATNEAGSASAVSSPVSVTAAPQPPPVVVTPGGGGGGGGGTTTTPPPTTTTTDVVLTDNPDLTAEFTTGGPTTGFDSGGGKPAVDAWEYLVNAVEKVFTDIEADFEGVTLTDLGAEAFTIDSVASAGVVTGLEIADFPVIAFAVALILGEWVFGWIIDRVARLFPDPSLFGWHPLGFIKTGLERMGTGLEHSATDVGKFVVSLIVTPVRQLVGLFQRAYNAIVGAHNKASTIVNQNIPAAEAKALENATKLTNETAQAMVQAAVDAFTTLRSYPDENGAKALVQMAANTGGLAASLIGLAAAAVVATDEYADTLVKNGNNYTDKAVQKAEQVAQDALTKFQTVLLAQLSTEEAGIIGLDDAVTQALERSIAGDVQAQINNDQQIAAAATADLQAQIAPLIQQAIQLQQQIVADEQIIAVAEGDIQAQAAQPVPDQSIIDDAESRIQNALTDMADAQTKITHISTTVSRIGDNIAKIQQQVQLNTLQLAPFEAVGAVALPTIIATMTKTLSKIKNTVDQCMVDNCDTTNPNNIRNVLRDLFGLLTAGAEIGFIAEAIHDPQGTANALAPFLEGFDTAAVDTLNALLSL